jgi:translation initiation factor IF-1
MVKQENLSADRQGKIGFKGEVIESLPNATFKVRLDDGRVLLCHLSGKMRIHHIKVMVGDWVSLEMTPYDETKGRIIQRF